VRTEDFVSLAGTHAGEDLSNFFTPWLQQRALPHLPEE
jgi:aminopeptidase N